MTIFVYDIDDNPPMFSSDVFSLTIEDDTSDDSVIFIASASDADLSNGSISYGITHGNSDGKPYSTILN